MSTLWSPLALIKSSYAVLLLNRPIPYTLSKFEVLWNEATIRVCVDGGTNRLFELIAKLPKLKNPHLITGDFDSIRDEVKNYYEKQEGVKIIHTPDQDYTDFTKALMTVEKGITNEEFPHVDSFIVVVDSGGRVDQMFSNICTLFKTNLKHLKVYITTEETITWVLKSGSHTIKVDDASKRHCGLIPMCGATKIITKGLTWDLDDVYDFQGKISTNNLISETIVEIETEGDILWTMDLHNTD